MNVRVRQVCVDMPAAPTGAVPEGAKPPPPWGRVSVKYEMEPPRTGFIGRTGGGFEVLPAELPPEVSSLEGAEAWLRQTGAMVQALEAILNRQVLDDSKALVPTVRVPVPASDVEDRLNAPLR